MTLGVTGVFWLPRKALINSTTLNAGAHAIPISAAAGAWGAMGAAYAEATATLVRVMAELGAGLEGVNGVAAIARLAGFTAWTEQMAATAAITSAKAAANATAYTVASIAMPSAPEIVAVYAAKTAAYSTGGVVNGSAEAAEAAEIAMDIRAAIVMEIYEAATSVLAIPTGYVPAPPIANGAGAAQGADKAMTADEARANPLQAATMAAGALLQSPGVQSAALQAGQIAGTTASTAASAATNIGSAAISAATNSASGTSMGAPMSAMGGLAAMSGGGSGSTRAVSLSGGSVGGGANVQLPQGWGQPAVGSVGGVGGSGGPATPGFGSGGGMDPSAATRAASSGPMMGNRGLHGEDDEQDRETPDYLKNFEHFADGRTAIPAVIGADPSVESAR